MSNAQLENVKVGDWVWEGSQPLGQFFPKHGMARVVAVTPTGFRVENRPNDLYKKATGRSYRGSTYKYYAIARPDEVAEWQAKQEAARQEREAQKAADEARTTKRAELRELFADFSTAICGEPTNRVYVVNAAWGNDSERKNKFDLQFHNLTEDEIRRIASIVSVAEFVEEGEEE